MSLLLIYTFCVYGVLRCIHFNRAFEQHSYNATFHWNFQKYSVKIICYHRLSVSEISKITHCGILINMCYCYLLLLSYRFIKMSEDNMNAVTSLQREEHVNKELSNRLAQVEDELNQTGSDLADKQR